MKTHRLQAAFARKREADHMRTERTAAVDRYYCHWGKVTSKFENWTGPEYYEQADENLRQSKEKKLKEEKLKERREKLKNQLEREKASYQEELAILRRPKSRNMSTDVMEKIDQNFKARSAEKRRLELEAKLYGRLRHGVDDESLLYESKSNNQVLAKLNWLDKQIEDQLHREDEEKSARERTIRMQEEICKTEQYHKERQIIREKEIKEIRALQEKHVQELKMREKEAESLKSEANYLQNALEQFSDELISLDHNKKIDLEETPVSHNLRRIKMIIRTRSEAFSDKLQSDIALLERIGTLCPGEKAVANLLEKMQWQREMEMLNLAQIESMYESEAKVNLFRCEEVWRKLNYDRYLDLTKLIKDLQTHHLNKFYENQSRQKELIDIRATHLTSIENTNEQLKLLVKEGDASPRPIVCQMPQSVREVPHEPLTKITDSFTNLNLDCLSGGDETISQQNSSRMQQFAPPDSPQRPKYGRKKVAWM